MSPPYFRLVFYFIFLSFYLLEKCLFVILIDLSLFWEITLGSSIVPIRALLIFTPLRVLCKISVTSDGLIYPKQREPE